ncbi:hypothetical protein DFH06DRAFT_1483453 [Mycena polygramma]|nr:hypothetical protein DFH06DRAFT_1483453 [Mycena polygramma]
MSYGTFALPSPVHANTPDIHVPARWAPAVTLLAEVLATALTSFLILVALLSLAGIDFTMLSAVKVTFGFSCLVYGLIDTTALLWHRARNSGAPITGLGELEEKSRSWKDVEAMGNSPLKFLQACDAGGVDPPLAQAVWTGITRLAKEKNNFAVRVEQAAAAAQAAENDGSRRRVRYGDEEEEVVLATGALLGETVD